MTVVDTAVLLLRVTVGLTMVAHRYNHLWGGRAAGSIRSRTV